MNNNTKLLCLFLKSQKIATSSEQGYSMLMVSMVTIVMFSLLLAATTLSNLTKSRTNAFVDGNSAFYVAEAGLNKRAAEISKKLDYPGINGSVSGDSIESCLGVGIPAGGSGESTRSGNNDLECVNYRFISSNNIASGMSLDSGGQDQNTYVAYTLVTDKTSYVGGVPQFARIPAGDYAGLNAFDYKYVISAMGKKPVNLPQGSSMPVYTDDQIAAKNRQTTSAATEIGDPALITAYDSITTQANAVRTAATNAAQDSNNNTTLSMTFTKRVVPLFQFGIFYNGDLELNSTSDMQIDGRVHSNANMYLQPAGLTGVTATATFMSKVSAVGSIYNRVDAWPLGLGSDRPGITRFLRTGTTNTYDNLTNDRSLADPLSATKINEIPNKQLIGATPAAGATAAAAGATALKTPSPGFTRKRNYATNAIGEYFAKADMRLEMVPDRDIVSPGSGISGKAATPWTRNKAIVPFNFTAIRTGGTGTCTTTLPTAGNDPVATYVDPLRDNFSALRCNVFTKGQLQSLRQPVMVLTNINQTRGLPNATTNAGFRTLERQTLGAPTTLPTPPTLSLTANTDNTKKQIIRALQVAIASYPKPISLETLDKNFDDAGTFTTGDLAAFKSTFSILINGITLDSSDRYNLLRAKPTEIAALQINGMGAWFLPAPIQRIERPTHTDSSENNSSSYDGNGNPRNSGFYDGREKRWITMLQTNIASLSVWNRDGLYVKATDDGTTEDLKTAYSPGTTAATDTLAIVTTAGVTTGVGTTNNTDGLAFDRVTTFTTGSTEIYPVGSLQYLGLGSRDKTEGGLIFHATVNDDLDGSGGALAAANDITVDTGDTAQRILKKKADNTNEQVDPSCTTSCALVVLDYYRKYPSQTASKQSPFAFAINGGNYLPNALMLSSDQSVYVQGNFNNNNNNDATNLPPTGTNTRSPDRLPAAIVADTITVLSNQCIGGSIVPSGQLSCGLPPQINGSTQLYNGVTSAIAINAAFLSNTQVSRGNKGTGRGSELSEANRSYSGGVNNYIRLLEDWNNGDNPIALNYSGSLISLNEPIEYGGAYRSGGIDPADPVGTSYYNVPFRNFGYDTNFDTVTKIPPLTPKASFILQSSFTRKY
jgi:hypothetical protein